MGNIGTTNQLLNTAGTLTPGRQVSIDDSSLSSVDADNTQGLASELDRAFAILAGTQPGTPGARFEGPFIPFTSSVNVDTAGVSLYAGNIALYARSDDARVDFILPTDAEITASGVDTDEQVEFSILNQAGTARFDTGGGISAELRPELCRYQEVGIRGLTTQYGLMLRVRTTSAATLKQERF